MLRDWLIKWLEYFVWEKNSWKVINFWPGSVICEPRPGVYIPYPKKVSKISSFYFRFESLIWFYDHFKYSLFSFEIILGYWRCFATWKKQYYILNFIIETNYELKAVLHIQDTLFNMEKIYMRNSTCLINSCVANDNRTTLRASNCLISDGVPSLWQKGLHVVIREARVN